MAESTWANPTGLGCCGMIAATMITFPMLLAGRSCQAQQPSEWERIRQGESVLAYQDWANTNMWWIGALIILGSFALALAAVIVIARSVTFLGAAAPTLARSIVNRTLIGVGAAGALSVGFWLLLALTNLWPLQLPLDTYDPIHRAALFVFGGTVAVGLIVAGIRHDRQSQAQAGADL